MGEPVAALLDQLGPNVRVVYGHGERLRGAIGSQTRFAYGTVLKDFGKMLESLFQVEFGSSKEL